MTPIERKSKVGPDGVLTRTAPVVPSEADRAVRVVESIDPRAAASQAERESFIIRTAGSGQGDFERPESGEANSRRGTSGRGYSARLERLDRLRHRSLLLEDLPETPRHPAEIAAAFFPAYSGPFSGCSFLAF